MTDHTGIEARNMFGDDRHNPEHVARMSQNFEAMNAKEIRAERTLRWARWGAVAVLALIGGAGLAALVLHMATVAGASIAGGAPW
jgi:hypothetical protein